MHIIVENGIISDQSALLGCTIPSITLLSAEFSRFIKSGIKTWELFHSLQCLQIGDIVEIKENDQCHGVYRDKDGIVHFINTETRTYDNTFIEELICVLVFEYYTKESKIALNYYKNELIRILEDKQQVHKTEYTKNGVHIRFHYPGTGSQFHLSFRLDATKGWIPISLIL